MSSTRSIYDNCAYQQWEKDSVGPLLYQLYPGKFESCARCGGPVQETPLASLVDIESELKNQTRYATKCPQFKYNPTCKYSTKGPHACISTFDKKVPFITDPEVCKLFYVFNNLKMPTNAGYTLPCPNPCK